MLKTFEGETYIRLKDLVHDLQTPLIMAPFLGGFIPIQVMELDSVKIQACGDFSLIQTFADQIRKGKSKDILAYVRVQHRIVKASMVQPTYEELLEACKIDKMVQEHDEAIKEIREKVMKLKPGPVQQRLEIEIQQHELWTDFPLPNNFLAFVLNYALGIDKSDINLVSQKMLLEWAVLAEKHSKAPSDYAKGVFTDFNLLDIDRRAYIALAKEREK